MFYGVFSSIPDNAEPLNNPLKLDFRLFKTERKNAWLRKRNAVYPQRIAHARKPRFAPTTNKGRKIDAVLSDKTLAFISEMAYNDNEKPIYITYQGKEKKYENCKHG